MFLSEAMASDTLRLSLWNRFCKAEDSRIAVEEAEAAEEEGDEEEAGLLSGGHSDLSWVRISTCSTMSSSVLVRLDQHSKAAAMATTEREISAKLKSRLD